MIKVLFLAIVVVIAIAPVPAKAEDEKARDEGLFSNGSFLSEAISSVTDKLGKVGTGDERIVSDNALGIDKDTLEYDRDPLGRPLPPLRRDDFYSHGKDAHDKGDDWQK